MFRRQNPVKRRGDPKTKAECDTPLTKNNRYDVDVPGFLLLLKRKRQRSSTKVVLYQRTKIQPAAADGRSSTQVVLPDNENPAGRRGRPFQYSSCTTREKIQPAAGDGRTSTKVVLPENENPGSRRRRPFQY